MKQETMKEHGFYVVDGITRWDHENLSNIPRIRTLQYRCAGYDSGVIIKLIKAIFGAIPKVTIYHWMNNSTWEFQPRTHRRAMEKFFKELNEKHLGKVADDSLEFSYNKNIPIQKQRKFIGLTKKEKKIIGSYSWR